ncbi:hypothetical protein KL86SPO_50409 [uncultured Sporomusa sp.]|uniref:Uncharacterized protein n=1 Tax=uncultured Sporomusa sp. TaxID=307249 RepID=A0A212LYN0_9FIRM|nr:hypothetical protein KL86SPO_50409 [uncultured Sporomusa sp.]
MTSLLVLGIIKQYQLADGLSGDIAGLAIFTACIDLKNKI